MENNKRFYWIKLKTNFFGKDEIDFLLSQKNGCQYVVLYQMLCLQTANTNGELISKLGEVIVPYDVNKIVRDTKYFDFDTVTVALELFKKLGLIYQEENGNLRIPDLINMVGSESASKSAIKKREQRLNKKIEAIQKDKLGDKTGTNCLIEYRDKSIENRDIDNRDEESVSASVSNATFNLSDTPIGELINRHEITDVQIQKQILGYINNGMDLEVINNALMIPYDRNVMNFDFENEEAPINSPLDYGLQILENWFNFGVRTMYDVKKYNKLNKNRNEMLGGGNNDN